MFLTATKVISLALCRVKNELFMISASKLDIDCVSLIYSYSHNYLNFQKQK